MSKTYVYLIVLIGVYLVVVKGLGTVKSESGKSSTHTSSSGRVHGGGGTSFRE